MFDPEKTRQQYLKWLRSPGFARYCAGMLKPIRKWPLWVGLGSLILGGVTLAVMALLLRSGLVSKDAYREWADKVGSTFAVAVVLGVVLTPLALNDRLKHWKARRIVRKMFKQQDVILCGIVIANQQLLRASGTTAPALLVGAIAPCSETLTEEISAAAVLLSKLYGEDPAKVPHELRAACRLVNDDDYQAHRRRQAPELLCKRHDLVLFDAILHADNWGGSTLDSPFVACSVAREAGSPIFHLPDEIIAWTCSKSGAPILRHDKIEDQDIVMEETPYAREIETHIERHIGTGDSVFHEMLSTTVHVDIHIVPPSASRDWITLVTSGMSTRPMATPERAEHLRRAELMLRLPRNWPLGDEAFKDGANYWPLRWLKQLARFPHALRTWLCVGHSIPNGDPAESLHSSVKFTGWVVTRPRVGGEGFETLECSDGEVIHFFSIVPIFTSEMDLKLREGFESLDARFAQNGVTDLIDTNRIPVA